MPGADQRSAVQGPSALAAVSSAGVATKSCDTNQIWHRLFDIEVIARGELRGAAEYARRKIGGLGRLTHQPVLFARVRLTKHLDPAVQRPVVAQANVDVDGRSGPGPGRGIQRARRDRSA